jgi:acetyl esterase
MALDADAQQLLDLMPRALPASLDASTIGAVRAQMAEMGAAAPPGPDVHEVGDRGVPGPDGDIPVRVYRPSDASSLPVLVWLHGGGFALGDLSTGDATCRTLANEVEAIVVSVDYRLAPEHPFPAGVEDCYAATAWVAAHAAELGGDPARVAVGGDSAGGTLSAAVALMARDRGGPALVAQLLVYPTALMRVCNLEFADGPILTASVCEDFWQLYQRTDADRTNPYFAPGFAEDLSGLPPAFVVVPEADPTRDDQEWYGRKLAEAGVLATVKRYPGSFHGFFGMAAMLARGREAQADAVAMLRGVFAAAARTATPVS